MDGECMNCGEVGNWCRCGDDPGRPAEPSTTLAEFTAREQAAAEAGDSRYPALSAAERQAAFEWTCRFGPGNCWTGTTGEAAIIIRSLLLELAERGAK